MKPRRDNPASRPQPVLALALGGSFLLHVAAALAIAHWPLAATPPTPPQILLAEGETTARVAYLPSWMADLIAESEQAAAAGRPPAATTTARPAGLGALPRADPAQSPPAPLGRPTPVPPAAESPDRFDSLKIGTVPIFAPRSTNRPEISNTLDDKSLRQHSDLPKIGTVPILCDVQKIGTVPIFPIFRGVRDGVKLLDPPTPEYPPASRRLGEEGTVVVEVDVSADGWAGRVRLVEPSPFPRLNEAALAAARQARYAPARDSAGRPVPATLRIPFRFELH